MGFSGCYSFSHLANKQLCDSGLAGWVSHVLFSGRSVWSLRVQQPESTRYDENHY